MAFIQESPNKLILTFRPWYMWIVAGLCCCIWLPFFSIFASQFTTNALICQRSQAQSETCHLVQTNILFFHTKNIPIGKLQGAKFDKHNISDSTGQFQRVILITNVGEIVFSSVKTFRPNITSYELNNITDKINLFVNNPQESNLKIEKEDIFIVRIFVVVVIMNLLWLAFCSDVVTCVFDKSRGSLTKKCQWFFIISRTVEYQLQDIIDIHVQERRNRSVTGYRITLLRNSGKDIHLTSYHTNYFKGRQKMDETAEAIAKFLGRYKILY
ncbi:hypothetical protein [Calothrix sp. NIES-2098]|uniref:hypothetical protein n=1 Tax=Calothrix sp. NIES-2098 TaxID=1954171 RepID=UPI000B5F0484|nr:hypothetical protein NIES2098_64600 [Calothrix sp. NIES-2098]